MNSSSRTKKVLAPLAVLLAAGALAVGSGATFTSTSSNSISSVTAGTLTQSNTKDGQAIFNLTNMKPGDSVTGSLTLKNTGSLPAAFSLTEKASSNTFSKDMLLLEITDGSATPVYSGEFGGLADGTKNTLGNFAPDAAKTYTFKVTLVGGATNTEQTKTASATYQWDSIQLDGEAFTTP